VTRRIGETLGHLVLAVQEAATKDPGMFPISAADLLARSEIEDENGGRMDEATVLCGLDMLASHHGWLEKASVPPDDMGRIEPRYNVKA